MPAFYFNSLSKHSRTSTDEIVGAISLAYSQRHYEQKKELTLSWQSSIEIIKTFYTVNQSQIPGIQRWSILYEYIIPRRDKRIDAVIISDRVIYAIEFKIGQSKVLQADLRQLQDYCADLRDFHLESRERPIVPILLASESLKNDDLFSADVSNDLSEVRCPSVSDLGKVIMDSEFRFRESERFNATKWNESAYMPTPTIIEAAQALYSRKSVTSISRNQAGIENLKTTTQAVLDAIQHSQETKTKSICFITGVPGAGKTLAGLNIVHNRDFQSDDKELGVFLSGNSPLVKVLKEALTRDFSEREKVTRTEANHKVGTFIQNVHTFIDDYYDNPDRLPPDRVLIYDEAQRAWTAAHKTRKSNGRITESEPDILLSIMNRLQGWATIICLVGGGQEINTGEAGLREWGRSLETKYGDWHAYISKELKDGDHSTGHLTLFQNAPKSIKIVEDERLHLNVAIRAIRAKGVSQWVALLLDLQKSATRRIFCEEMTRFPVFLTRNIETVREWLRSSQSQTSRTGIIASSGGRRLRAIGCDSYHGLRGDSSQQELGAWYLNDPNDVRSSNFLEVVATEYAVQGLEIDWAGVIWDADLRLIEGKWEARTFKGTKWQKVRDQQKQYTLNKYRVLLTRARQGMIICVPKGDSNDSTRLPEYYDGTYEYLKEIGIPVIADENLLLRRPKF